MKTENLSAREVDAMVAYRDLTSAVIDARARYIGCAHKKIREMEGEYLVRLCGALNRSASRSFSTDDLDRANRAIRMAYQAMGLT